jgi:hypothetical protein
MTFGSQRDAKQLLVNKIVAEARRQGTPLSEPERLMLFFTEDEPETVAAIPQEMLNDDNVEYEQKITKLLRAAYERDRDDPEELLKYKSALRTLKDSDHYILVMAEPALAQATRARDLLRFAAIVLAVTLAFFLFAFWRARN